MDTNCPGCIYFIENTCEVNLVGPKKDEIPDDANCFDPTIGLD